MKSLSWFCACACACAWVAIGCGATGSTESTDPIGFKFESAAGSFASFGWTGAFHNIVEPLGTPFGVDVTQCGGGVCRFEGPTEPGGPVNRRRCLYHMSKTCSADTDCPLDNGNATPCVYIYDAPLTTPLATGNKIGACAWSYIPIAAAGHPPSIAGTLNLASGALSFEALTILLQFNGDGVGAFRGACAECVGDRTFNDGVKEGHCVLATKVGNPATALPPDMSPDVETSDHPATACDVNRSGEFEGYGGNYSMDCSPTVSSKAQPLPFGGPSNSLGLELKVSDASPTTTLPVGGEKKTFCGVCTDTKAPCMSGDECANKTCSNASLSVASDSCAGSCTWNDLTGTGGCMTNTIPSRLVGCYPSGTTAKISVLGHEERIDHIGTTFLANTGSARCLPPTVSPETNALVGLPGLLFQKRNYQITPQYTENKQ
jgi:hypothetical protein